MPTCGQPAERNRADKPLVSVLMSVYNGEEYLREAVESILNQTFVDFEFVIVDNGSTDRTSAILDNYHDSRIVRLRNPRTLLLPESLNEGLRVCRGDLVARQDADDISLPERLVHQVEEMRDNPETVLLGTWAEYICHGGRSPRYFLPPTTHRDIVRVSWQQNAFAHASVIFRRDAANREGGYPAEYVVAQDLALWLKLMRRYKVANLPKVLVQIRIHAAQMVQRKEIARVRDRELFSLLAFAASHPDLENLGVHPSAIRSALIRAQSLSREGRHARALISLATDCLCKPILWKSFPAYWRPMARTLIGPRAMKAAVSLRRLVLRDAAPG